ncbi:hypothetical protein SAMN02745857_00089 [Andreprevotia lacus DSM 23236]|jgi:hypothetical protein|uniref:Uncharacterized protein n=1 Tax=Andreprevotia lacus DSM 23236 TaxID=1121001 RepID=A0A1W1WWN4_9NEIS|nr:hypothetical protein [Andreprevotia lacus]SMC16065.1 hypothetical protein SAMN02745857_00089 [Andreprevotia lacus DSM 23236]
MTQAHWRQALMALAAAALGTLMLLQQMGWLPLHPADQQPSLQCADLSQTCHFMLGGRDYEVRSAAPLSGGKPVLLQVRGEAAKVEASWQMQGMEMGPNRYLLQQQAPADWRASTALPICTQRRTDWQLTLTIDGQTARILTKQQ